MSSFVHLAICALAVARLTILVTTDKITDRPRAWLNRRYPDRYVTRLLACPIWCTSLFTSTFLGSLIGLTVVESFAVAMLAVPVIRMALNLHHGSPGWLDAYEARTVAAQTAAEAALITATKD
jgi:hypothetical protein